MKITLILLFAMGINLSYFYSKFNDKLKKYCYRVSHISTEKYQEEYRQKFIKEFNATSFKITTEDSISLDAFVIERPSASRTILMVHGYRQSKEYLYNLVKLFNEDNIVLIDLRAHGLSEGKLISWGYHESKDVKAALKFIKTKESLASLPLFVIGHSMGSISVLKSMSELSINDVKAIVLDSGFADLEEQLEYMVESKSKSFKTFFPVIRYSFNKMLSGVIYKLKPYRLMQDIRVPVFILHSKADKIVPVSCAYKLYDNISNKVYKNIWIVNSSKHLDISKDYEKEYKSKLLEFFNKSLLEVN